MCVTLIAAVLFVCHQLWETWTALKVWKGSATNPFQLVAANYRQVGQRQIREASLRLQEAAERQGEKEGEASKVSQGP